MGPCTSRARRRPVSAPPPWAEAVGGHTTPPVRQLDRRGRGAARRPGGRCPDPGPRAAGRGPDRPRPMGARRHPGRRAARSGARPPAGGGVAGWAGARRPRRRVGRARRRPRPRRDRGGSGGGGGGRRAGSGRRGSGRARRRAVAAGRADLRPARRRRAAPATPAGPRHTPPAIRPRPRRSPARPRRAPRSCPTASAASSATRASSSRRALPCSATSRCRPSPRSRSRASCRARSSSRSRPSARGCSRRTRSPCSHPQSQARIATVNRLLEHQASLAQVLPARLDDVARRRSNVEGAWAAWEAAARDVAGLVVEASRFLDRVSGRPARVRRAAARGALAARRPLARRDGAQAGSTPSMVRHGRRCRRTRPVSTATASPNEPAARSAWLTGKPVSSRSRPSRSRRTRTFLPFW